MGPLWQGRFKNWYVYQESYLYLLLRYIEQNPIKANLEQHIGEYKYSSSWNLLHEQNLELMDGSMLLEKEIFALAGKVLDEDEIKRFDKYQKMRLKNKENEKKPISLKRKALNAYFTEDLDISQRNQNILKAIKDGYTQSEIGRHLGLSRSTISSIVKRS